MKKIRVFEIECGSGDPDHSILKLHWPSVSEEVISRRKGFNPNGTCSYRDSFRLLRIDNDSHRFICFFDVGKVVDIFVRRVEGKIVPLKGFNVLDNALSTSKEVKVKVVDTSENIVVIRDEYGDIVEKRKCVFTE